MISLKKTGPMQFTTTFDKNYPDLLFDEPVDIGGEDKYPNASKILTAAVASCLSASLTMCLNKARIPVDKLETKANCSISQNEEGYLRITQIDVQLIPHWDKDISFKKKDRCSKIFKNLCIATNAVTTGVPVNVNVQLE